MTSIDRIPRLVATSLVLLSLALSGCAGMDATTFTTHAVQVKFDNNCPESVDPDPLTLHRGDKVTWITQGDVSIEFWIVFDPFVGRSFHKKPGKTSVTSTPVRNSKGNKAPLAEYKYTIVTSREKEEEADPDPTKCKALDPRFIVSR